MNIWLTSLKTDSKRPESCTKSPKERKACRLSIKSRHDNIIFSFVRALSGGRTIMIDMKDLESEFDAILAETRRKYFKDYTKEDLEDTLSEETGADTKESTQDSATEAMNGFSEEAGGPAEAEKQEPEAEDLSRELAKSDDIDAIADAILGPKEEAPDAVSGPGEEAPDAAEVPLGQTEEAPAEIPARDETARQLKEAAEESIQAMSEEYEQNIRSLQDMYEKNTILVERLRDMNMETTSQMRDTMQEITNLLGTRNDQTKPLSKEEVTEDILASIQQSQEKIAALLEQSDDFNHKENVRVYRNIQASTAQELEKRNAELTKQIEELKEAVDKAGKKKGINVIQILILIAIVAILILQMLSVLGMI